eukprot:CAMPEP_0202978776 /NCGR_PEP_ID=MMETSP1396-20130829/85099_1 /ASSEMBLY_ACC=CAM_ASM_000872 /TAXON_ID= /ORGANISM="Pseudokeronopsis sp., Strain Brazil" /LENGTH=65 /DNA_ID=CAMNT_0049717883 /DNA_START=210 /DNA_END=407 /DNA_ORIENTATION=-
MKNLYRNLRRGDGKLKKMFASLPPESLSNIPYEERPGRSSSLVGANLEEPEERIIKESINDSFLQ